jgi:hypothetical protein
MNIGSSLKRSPCYSDRICDSQQLGIPWNQRKPIRREKKKNKKRIIEKKFEKD